LTKRRAVEAGKDAVFANFGVFFAKTRTVESFCRMVGLDRAGKWASRGDNLTARSTRLRGKI
jgi:hypothetical protein